MKTKKAALIKELLKKYKENSSATCREELKTVIQD
jgi:hypothetical protein